MRRSSAFGWTVDVVPDASDYDEVGHLGNAPVARLLDVARTEWFRSLPGREPGRFMVVRSVTILYEREALPGEALRCGVRAVSRTNRSILVDQELWKVSDDEVVARGTAVHVCFEAATRSAVAVWPVMLDAIADRQGEPLGVEAR